MQSATSDYIFTYSSLLKGFSSPEYEYITRYFNYIGPAKTKGQLNILHNIIVGTPSDEETFIHGELYRIKEEDQFSFAIGQLDGYEGVNPEPPEQPLYKREMTTAILEDGTHVNAWVYWYNRNVTGLPVLKSGNVLDFLQRNSG